MAKAVSNLQKESGGIVKISPVEVITQRTFTREEINRCEEALNISVSE